MNICNLYLTSFGAENLYIQANILCLLLRIFARIVLFFMLKLIKES
jgi:hypothetical protein